MFACIASKCSFAQHTTTADQPATQELNKQNAELVSVRDTLLTNDSIIVIHTVCAPICSSHARIYNKEWKEIGVLKPPFKSPFPEAYIEDGRVLWRDNDNFDYSPLP